MSRLTLRNVHILYLFVSVNILHGQNISHTFYYPLNIGDYWEYVERPQGFQKTVEVIGDSLMSDGHEYRLIEEGYLLNSKDLVFQRVNEQDWLLQFEPHRQEAILFFKFDLSVGDRWHFALYSPADSVSFEVKHIADTTLWDRRFKYALIEDDFDIAPSVYYLGDSLGVFFHGFEGGFEQLTGGIVDGLEFGTLTGTPRGSFYPLHIGDIWQYQDQTNLEIETHEVVGDTLINEQTYYVFHVAWSHPSIPERFYYRTLNDSSWVVEYSQDARDGSWQEVIAYKLNAGFDEHWEALTGPTQLDSIGLASVFGKSHPALFYGVFNGFFTHQEVLARELGFVGRFGEGEVSTTILQGAIIAGNQFGNVTHVGNNEPQQPVTTILKPNYPNPFNAETRIAFETPSSGFVSLKIFNLLGEEVRSLFEHKISQGPDSIVWDGEDNLGNLVSSGIYIYRLRHTLKDGTVTLSRKLLLLK